MNEAKCMVCQGIITTYHGWWVDRGTCSVKCERAAITAANLRKTNEEEALIFEEE